MSSNGNVSIMSTFIGCLDVVASDSAGLVLVFNAGGFVSVVVATGVDLVLSNGDVTARHTSLSISYSSGDSNSIF